MNPRWLVEKMTDSVISEEEEKEEKKSWNVEKPQNCQGRIHWLCGYSLSKAYLNAQLE